MIERELADLLLNLQAAHQEAAQNDSFWTSSTIAFHWNYRRVRVSNLSPERQEAYKQGLLTELAEAGSANAWVDKLIAERRRSASRETELPPESDSQTVPEADPASEEPTSPTLPQLQPIDYPSKARELLGAGKSPITGLWNLVHDPAVDWADDAQNWKKAYLKLVREEANLPYFAAQVYYDALKEFLADPKQH